MADFMFNIAKGAFAEKIRDGASNVGVLLLIAADADDTMRDTDTVQALLALSGTTEATDGSYSRRTGITGTLTVDDTNNRVDADIPDQTWTALAGAAITDLIVYYSEGGTDADRVPLTCHDFPVTPDGSDVTAQFNAAGFARAS